MKKFIAKNVDEYIKKSPIESHCVQNKLRKLILSTVPGIPESISRSVPFYRTTGTIGGFSVHKNHISLGFDATLSEDTRNHLTVLDYKTGTYIIQMQFEQNLPENIIRKLLLFDSNKLEHKLV